MATDSSASEGKYGGREMKPLSSPLRLEGEVVKGYGRGSKLLGIPTANLPVEALGKALDDVDAGVYFGWAQVPATPSSCRDLVLFVIRNPYFKNETKTFEPHLIHKFEQDFYGEQLKVLVAGYMRPEKDYDSIDALVEDIHKDIDCAKEVLSSAPFEELKKDSFFHKE